MESIDPEQILWSAQPPLRGRSWFFGVYNNNNNNNNNNNFLFIIINDYCSQEPITRYGLLLFYELKKKSGNRANFHYLISCHVCFINVPDPLTMLPDVAPFEA